MLITILNWMWVLSLIMGRVFGYGRGQGVFFVVSLLSRLEAGDVSKRVTISITERVRVPAAINSFFFKLEHCYKNMNLNFVLKLRTR